MPSINFTPSSAIRQVENFVCLFCRFGVQCHRTSHCYLSDAVWNGYNVKLIPIRFLRSCLVLRSKGISAQLLVQRRWVWATWTPHECVRCTNEPQSAIKCQNKTNDRTKINKNSWVEARRNIFEFVVFRMRERVCRCSVYVVVESTERMCTHSALVYVCECNGDEEKYEPDEKSKIFGRLHNFYWHST